jgi:hypothetical protein
MPSRFQLTTYLSYLLYIHFLNENWWKLVHLSSHGALPSLNVMSLGGQCLNAMWSSLGGQCLNATWHLINENFVWPIKHGFISHPTNHCLKLPIEPLMNTLATWDPQIPKKNLNQTTNCLFDGFLIPLETNYHSKPLSLLKIHYSGTTTKWVVCTMVI